MKQQPFKLVPRVCEISPGRLIFPPPLLFVHFLHLCNVWRSKKFPRIPKKRTWNLHKWCVYLYWNISICGFHVQFCENVRSFSPTYWQGGRKETCLIPQSSLHWLHIPNLHQKAGKNRKRILSILQIVRCYMKKAVIRKTLLLRGIWIHRTIVSCCQSILGVLNNKTSKHDKRVGTTSKRWIKARDRNKTYSGTTVPGIPLTRFMRTIWMCCTCFKLV